MNEFIETLKGILYHCGEDKDTELYSNIKELVDEFESNKPTKVPRRPGDMQWTQKG